jgi:hypothetical protein
LATILIGVNAWSAVAFFNGLDYGASKDGSANSTDAFGAAIQAAKAAGGGTVFIPAGNYLTGPIELVSDRMCCNYGRPNRTETYLFDSEAFIYGPFSGFPPGPNSSQTVFATPSELVPL